MLNFSAFCVHAIGCKLYSTLYKFELRIHQLCFNYKFFCVYFIFVSYFSSILNRLFLMEHIGLLMNSLNYIVRHMDTKRKIYKYIFNVSFTMPFYHDNKNKMCTVSYRLKI